MRVHIPDMTEFFSWMGAAGHGYVVLRGFMDFPKQGFPLPGAKQDIDLLVEDAAMAPIRQRYGHYRRRQGVKCDIYNVTGAAGGDWLGHPYFPQTLARKTLADRRLWRDMFYVPSARSHLLTLAYHIAYQKAETSCIDIADPEKSHLSKYLRELGMLCAELNLTLPCTLFALHELLKKAGYSVSAPILNAILRNDFAHRRKSFFLASVCAEQAGEMNLFVIRGVAVAKKTQQHFLDVLRGQYEILAIKEIPFLTRLTKSRHMRGGKWRFGGRPHIAIVVWDPNPIPVTGGNNKAHPYVFNSRQFFKPALREWFTKTTGARPKLNPLHSTDNEAEAIGHLPLFFTAQEQAEIFRVVDARRAAMAANST